MSTETQPQSSQPQQSPPPSKRSFVYLASTLAGGNMLANLLRTAGGILQARAIAPSVLGLFTGLSLIQGYAPFLQLGILNGLNRELPYYIGKGDRERVDELAAAGQAWALAVGYLTSAIVMIVALWYMAHGRLWLAAGLATNAGMCFLLFYGQWYLQTIFLTSHQFARLALINVIQYAAALALVLPIRWIGFYGVCLRALIPTILATVLLYWWRPVRVHPKWNLQHLKHLLLIGAPIFGVGQLNTGWVLLDGTLVLKLMGTHGLGLYTMTVVASQLLGLLPSAVAQVVYPRMAERYGRTERLDEVVRLTIKPMLFTAAGLAVLVPIAWMLAGPVISFVVPGYREGIPSVQWSLPISIVLAFTPVSNAFNIVRRQDLLTAAIVIGAAVYGGALLVLIRGGVYLAAFPQAMIFGQAAYVVACYAFLGLLGRKERSGREA